MAGIASQCSATRDRWVAIALGFSLLLIAHGTALFFRVQPAVSLWFPPSGVAIALTFWLGPVGIWLTGCVSFLLAPFWGNDGWFRFTSLTDAIEPLVAWYLYRRYFRASLWLKNLRDAAAFMISVPLFACSLTAIVGALTLTAVHKIPSATLVETISYWWLGNALGAMVVAPVALILLTPRLKQWDWLPLHETEPSPTPPPQHLLKRHWIEIGIVLLSSLFFALLTVEATQVSIFVTLQLSLLSAIPVFWAVARFGVKGGVLVASFSVVVTLLSYLLLYPNALLSSQFPVNGELLHTHKLSLLLQCAFGLLAGAAITERAETQVALAVEQVRLTEYEARAHLSETLFHYNRLLTAANQHLQISEERIRRSEIDLRQAHERYQLAAMAVNGMIYDFDVPRRHVERTEGLLRILGYAPHEVPPTPDWWGEQIHPDDRQHLPPTIFETPTEEGCRSIEYRMRHRDGHTVYVMDQCFVLYDTESNPLRVVGNVTDISDRKQAEIQNQQLAALVENSTDCIGVANLEGVPLFLNPAGRRLLGITNNDLGSHLLEAFWEGDRPFVESIVLPTVKSEGSWEGEIRFRNVATEEAIFVYCNIFVVKDRQTGYPMALATVTRDITEQKRIETERTALLAREQTARQQAEAASRMKDEFLAIVSHELRSPLNGILGWARLLRARKLADDKTEQALASIERNAQVQTQLIEDLLDISRIIRGTVRLNLRPVNLNSVIQAALDTIRPTASNKSIHLEAQLKPSVSPVSGDSERLQQIVWNLLSNAVKFTPSGGQVEVRLETVQRPGQPVSAQIRVIDTGKGIAPEFLPYVFERFRQADSTTTRNQGGLGLGLAIARNLVELHGGSIRAESLGEGKGATFIVELPLLQTASEHLSATLDSDSCTMSHPLPLSIAGVRVLVVDDEADTREYLVTALEQFGAIVTVATSATEALTLFQKHPPDVLLSDIGMPGADGYSLIHSIRALPGVGGRVPAAALTAYVRGDDRLRALTAGFQMHVPKPIEPLRLLNVVAQLAGRSPTPAGE